MAGLVGNYVIAYGFVTSLTNKRYFERPGNTNDMEEVVTKAPYQNFLNEVGWFRKEHGVDVLKPRQRRKKHSCDGFQSGLYVFGERVVACEDGTLRYSGSLKCLHALVFSRKLRHRELIDVEARLNRTKAGYLVFMNDKDVD